MSACQWCALLRPTGCAKKLVAVYQLASAGLLKSAPGCWTSPVGEQPALKVRWQGPGPIGRLVLEHCAAAGGWVALDAILLHLFTIRGRWPKRRWVQKCLKTVVGLEHRRVVIGPFCGRLRNEYRKKSS